MANIKPFRAFRPNKEKISEVAELPYDVFDDKEARKIANRRQYSFIHVDRAEVDLDNKINPYSEAVYKKASQNLDKLIKQNVLMQDSEECLYLYELIMNGNSQVGLVCCTAVDDYINNVIKKHELTRKDKEKDRLNHISYCHAHTGPILMTYKHNNEIDIIIKNIIHDNIPEYEFIYGKNVINKVWKIEDNNKINSLKNKFQKINSLYIADGHHRAASAVKVALDQRKDGTQNDEVNYFLSVLFPSNQLNILDYNRVVSDLNGLNENEFINLLKVNFIVEKSESKYKPNKPHEFGMYLDKNWYKLTLKSSCVTEDIIDNLDVNILQHYILTPLLGIKDSRSDKRIDFVGGIKGLNELVKRVDDGMKIAFSMYPTSMDELIQIADNNKIMPPKSTWFEPKLLSGIFIHKF